MLGSLLAENKRRRKLYKLGPAFITYQIFLRLAARNMTFAAVTVPFKKRHIY
jgi:hypothetical protein